ncbi:hypothetical protein FRC17_005901 [Serendipita sp. 399]|nr:hypothetical protein FRC17_005901 [Serendipita sp. 399]
MQFVQIPTFTLNDGNKMPGIGMGCWMGHYGGGEEAARTVKIALELGYRHIDTAAGYLWTGLENEDAVGQSIAESGVPREELFVVTKLAMPDHGRVEEGLDRSLKALGLDYVDLYLMHWPQAEDPETGRMLRPHESPTFVETWLAMEKLLSTVLEFSKSKGMVVQAYTPMGRPSAPFYKDPIFVSMAEKYGVQIGQILLSWAVQHGTMPIPKSSNRERAQQNLQVVRLSQEDMTVMDEYHKRPGMHRALAYIGMIKDGKLFGWTMEELGWPYDDEAYVKS